MDLPLSHHYTCIMNDPLQLNPRRRYELVVDMTIVLSTLQFTCVIKQGRPGNGRGSSEGTHSSAPGTPGRFKLRSGGRGDELPDKGPTVPKFGEWDENNPSSADGYTQLFNQVREEKQTGAAKVPIITNDAMYLNSYNQGGSKSSSCCCFSWCRK
ncbi:RPM1-interacting protein 4-like isoform X1 [Iris pallida]|uniref:RPM1-interacting protein 4-like isoform X1 n=1 Tax=Iris pallida TaxID=29817 RepID=A0AAX6IC68_IRIPA|nr:RPM1-interacting protein 4-like isoform X1 [Iris pallida]